MRRPRFIAEQARHAKGPLGRLIAFIMARETRQHNLRALEALEVGTTDAVVDIGCGPGAALAALAKRTKGRLAGADPSDLMVKLAHQRNASAMRSKQMEIVVASASALPFAAGAFDKALCVHVVYFWTDLEPGLRETARVLKPGGKLVVMFRPSGDSATQAFPTNVYRFREAAAIRDALDAAGFEIEGSELASSPNLLVARLRA